MVKIKVHTNPIGKRYIVLGKKRYYLRVARDKELAVIKHFVKKHKNKKKKKGKRKRKVRKLIGKDIPIPAIQQAHNSNLKMLQNEHEITEAKLLKEQQAKQQALDDQNKALLKQRQLMARNAKALLDAEKAKNKAYATANKNLGTHIRRNQLLLGAPAGYTPPSPNNRDSEHKSVKDDPVDTQVKTETFGRHDAAALHRAVLKSDADKMKAEDELKRRKEQREKEKADSYDLFGETGDDEDVNEYLNRPDDPAYGARITPASTRPTTPTSDVDATAIQRRNELRNIPVTGTSSSNPYQQSQLPPLEPAEAMNISHSNQPPPPEPEISIHVHRRPQRTASLPQQISQEERTKSLQQEELDRKLRIAKAKAEETPKRPTGPRRNIHITPTKLKTEEVEKLAKQWDEENPDESMQHFRESQAHLWDESENDKLMQHFRESQAKKESEQGGEGVVNPYEEDALTEEIKNQLSGSGKGKHKKILGNMLYTNEINQVMSIYPQFKGTIAHDELKNKILPKIKPKSFGGVIINTDPSTKSGKHWEAIAWDARPYGKHAIYFFDSYGDEPDATLMADFKLIKEKLQSDQPLVLKINRVKQQSVNSFTCGWMSIKCLSEIFKGHSWKSLTGFTNVANGEKNVQKLRRKFNHYQHI